VKLRTLYILFAVVFALPAMAQRYGVVDTDYILSSMPEYEQAKGQLDKLSEQWAG